MTRQAHILKNIKNRRLKLGFSQEYIAVRLGISKKEFKKIELGRTNLTLPDLLKIAEILDTDPRTLLRQENYFPVVKGDKMIF